MQWITIGKNLGQIAARLRAGKNFKEAQQKAQNMAKKQTKPTAKEQPKQDINKLSKQDKDRVQKQVEVLKTNKAEKAIDTKKIDPPSVNATKDKGWQPSSKGRTVHKEKAQTKQKGKGKGKGMAL